MSADLIRTFYSAFQRCDGPAMAACYHADIVFNDPVFPGLQGERAGMMWRMLTAGAKDLKIEFDGGESDGTSGRAHWVATYTFSATGRKVVNDIQASFTFKDGLIAAHTDVFDFWKWSSQALGASGMLLGWTPIIRNAVRKQAAAGLDKFIERSRGA